MSLEELLLQQPLPFQEMDAAKIIARAGDGNIAFSIIIAMAYGIILGKREERAKRKGKAS